MFTDSHLLKTITGVAISIRTSNFGWAHPNRVVSQGVKQKIAAGHPKLGVEREVRASPWGFALIELVSKTGGRLEAGFPRYKRAVE
jgi:hypothetical protein